MPGGIFAQFAALVAKTSSFMNVLRDTRSTNELLKWLNVTTSAYWQSHTDFDQSGVPGKKTLGIASARSILINGVLPVMFEYGKSRND